MKKLDLLIIASLITALAVVLALRLESVNQQSTQIIINQELIKNASIKAANASNYAERAAQYAGVAASKAAEAADNILANQELIKTALNQSAENNENINRTQQALLDVNENLLTVYQHILTISIEIENNTNLHRDLARHDTDMLSFLRGAFNESYLEDEYRQYAQSNNTQKSLGEILDILKSSNSTTIQ